MLRLIKGIRLILTLDCEQSARMTSESFDRHLDWSERIAVRMHNAFCRRSRQLEKQLRALHAALERNRSQLDTGSAQASLSPQALEKIRKTIRQSIHPKSGEISDDTIE